MISAKGLKAADADMIFVVEFWSLYIYIYIYISNSV